MTTKRFRDAATDLRSGAIDYNEFVSRTHPDWMALARSVATRWRLHPNRGELRDLYQTAIFAGWRAVARFDPSKGMTFEEYVFMSGADKAKKHCHKLRGAKLSGNSGKNPSRDERPFSALGKKTDEPSGSLFAELEKMLRHSGAFTPATQEVAADRSARASAALDYCETLRERIVIGALAKAEGFADAATLIYSDPDTRLLVRAGSEAKARHIVRMDTHRVARRLAVAALSHEGEPTQ